MKERHYLVYQTTNLLNGKIYIGQHQTYDVSDGYLGSGKELGDDIKRFGRENFKREILFDFDSFEEMNDKERELVNEDFVAREDTYNLVVGGRDIKGNLTFLGKHHSEETKRKISEMKRKNPPIGKSNGMFDKHWYYNPSTLEQKPFELGKQPEGWIQGHIQEMTDATLKQREAFSHSTSGMVRAWNLNTFEVKYFNKDDELPIDWVRGSPPISEQARKVISEKTKEAVWKNKNLNEVIEFYTILHDVYVIGGFDLVKSRFNYRHSQQNLVKQFKKYVKNFKTQQGKKRGK